DLDVVNFTDLVSDVQTKATGLIHFAMASAITKEVSPTTLIMAHTNEDPILGNDDLHITRNNKGKVMVMETRKESCKTNSYALKDSMMQCENGQIDVLEHRHCIINYCNAPAGDSFCGIRVDSNSYYCTEIHQCKLVKSDVNDNMFKKEHQKAGDENDYFILFTTGRYTANLTWLSGVVDMDAWDAYFGSFSGKAFRYPPPVANRATFSELTGVNRIGEIQANMIIQKCPYNNLNDCYQKQTQLGL
ncbi:14670_t:CDS:2, partial [Entrophospora sp. SA101]